MEHFEDFRFCPKCGHAYRESDFNLDDHAFHCRHCERSFFQNTIPSATVVIPMEGSPQKIVLITRAIPPGEGLLALPGGIADYGETMESAACREALEETNLQIRLQRLLSMPVIDYRYRGRNHKVIEHMFLAWPIAPDTLFQSTPEATSVGFYDIGALIDREERFALPEQCRELAGYLETL